MLRLYLVKFQFFKYIQSGLYIDFILKQFCEIFVRNFFIYTPLFFGEKFIIEYVTKKTIDSYIFNFNNMFNFIDLDYSYFFIQLISNLLYVLSIINIFFLFNLL